MNTKLKTYTYRNSRHHYRLNVIEEYQPDILRVEHAGNMLWNLTGAELAKSSEKETEVAIGIAAEKTEEQ